MKGAVTAASSVDFASSSSYNDLWFRPGAQDDTLPGFWNDVTSQAEGPVVSLGASVAQGAQLAHDGQIERAVEHFLPQGVKGLAKAYRYMREGVKTLSGEQVLKPGQLSAWEIASTALGMTPQRIAALEDQRAGVKGLSKEIAQRKAALVNAYADAAAMGDTDRLNKLADEAAEFNAAHPGYAIDAKTIELATKNQFRKQLAPADGVPKGLRYELNERYGNPADALEDQTNAEASQ
jgi:hypothetical protein